MSSFETTFIVRDELRPPGPTRGARADQPVAIYEVHPSSWMRVPEEGNRPLSAGELGPKLADYANDLNFTHVQLLAGGNFHNALSSLELRELVDILRDHGLGVVLEGLPPDASVTETAPPDLRHFEGVPDIIEDLHADGICHQDVTFLTLEGRDFAFKRERHWLGAMLDYLAQDPSIRGFHHDGLFARESAAEEVLLAYSHDAAASGRGSLLARMPGDDWQKFANARLLLAALWSQPGKKLLFMGAEFGQWNEWNSLASLDWHLLHHGGRHRGLQQMVADLNRLYRAEPALQIDRASRGLEWGGREDAALGTIDWLRRGSLDELVLAAFNFTPVPRYNHRVGVPHGGTWLEVFNSDAREYGGSGQGNLGGVEASPLGCRQHSHSLTITLPPLGAVLLKAADRT